MESMMFKNRESRARILIIKYSGLVLLLTTLLSAGVVNAQTGIISGSVVSASNGEPLYGIYIEIQPSGKKAVTDSDGHYTLRGVRQGDYTLVASHFGYDLTTRSVFVESEGHHVENIELNFEFTDGDRVFSIEHQLGINRALTRQKQATHISSVISSEQIVGFADYSIENALIRVPGVQLGRRGELNIRGTGYNRFYVTVDGQRLGTTGTGNRSFDLGSISPDLIREVEVIKVLTPDLYADGLSGVVNLVTRQPATGQLRIDARAGGGGTPRYFKYHGVANSYSLNSFYSATDEISIALGVSYQTDHHPSEMLDIGYEVADFGNGPIDAIERVNPAINLHDDSRLASRLQINYQPSDRTSMHLQALINFNKQKNQQHTNYWSAGGDWINQDSTGLQGGQGTYGYEAAFRDVQNTQYAVQGGARHLFNWFNLDYSFGWAQTEVNDRYYEFPFAIEGLNYRTDWSDQSRPIMIPTNVTLQQDGSIDRRLVRLRTMRHITSMQIDNQYSGNINIEVPFRLGSVKFGGSALLSHKDGGYSDTEMDNIRPLTQYRFFMIQGGEFNVLNDYHIPWLVEMDRALNYLDTNEPIMRTNENLHFWNSDIWNHDIYENLYGGFAMAIFEIGNLTLLGGARMEYSDNTYEGRKVIFNRFGGHEDTVDTSRTNTNLHFFPHAQLRYDFGNWAVIRAAWSRSISRPDFNMVAPFDRISFQDLTLFRGNPELEPLLSENLDIIFDYYLSHIGQIGLGVFYKELSNFIILEQRPVSGGNFDGWQELTFINGDEKVNLYGVELSWQQRLKFLPGFLKNLGVYSNYTYTVSDFDGQYRTNVSYPGHSPHVVNAAVNYTQGRFTGQVSYHWRGELLDELQDTRVLAPSIGDQQVYLDRYRDYFDYLTASLGFRISENFRLWADMTNITGGRERTDYIHTREYYPFSLRRSGYSFKAGIRFTL